MGDHVHSVSSVELQCSIEEKESPQPLAASSSVSQQSNAALAPVSHDSPSGDLCRMTPDAPDGVVVVGPPEMRELGNLDTGDESGAEAHLNEDKEFLGKEKQSENMLETKKRQLLNDLEGGSIFGAVPGLKDVNDGTIGKDDSTDVDGYEIVGGGLSTRDEVEAYNRVDRSLKRSLKIEVIDETALIEPVPVIGEGEKALGKVTSSARCPERHEKKNVKQMADEKKTKRPRRKGKGMKKDMENFGNQDYSVLVAELVNASRANQDGTKRLYSRAELEYLRFVNAAEQRKLWREIYNGLGPVAREYEDLANCKHQAQSNLSSHCQRQSLGRAQDPGILGEGCNEQVDVVLENMKDKETKNVNWNPTCSENVSGEDIEFAEEEGHEDSEDSDEYYASIQRPAFSVKGEPNFDAGPPEDGLEYLRRVRWEAAQIPNVKVAKLDQSKFNKDQSTYMPVIPEIAKCPEHLMPPKEWEDAFLVDFSMLRTALSRVQSPSTETLGKQHVLSEVENYSSQLRGGGVSENFEGQTGLEMDGTVQPSDNPCPEVLGGEKVEEPTLSAILKMDPVARVVMLRKRILLIETASTLSRNDSLWLFALCAAVDMPLDADTCASLRSLLRKCASLRAQKAEVDEEVIMLNILATISGRYFGQSDS